MHNPYKKVTASLLLFSHMLTSCYNPNMGMGKQALPTPDPAYKQPQYAGELHDKYPPKPPSHIFTTADNHPVRFTYLNGQWQAAIEECASNGSWQRRELPVVFEPGLRLEDVVDSNPTGQKQLLHLCASEEAPDQPGYVYVGRAPSQAKPYPQLLSSLVARQAALQSEGGSVQQQATAQQQPKQPSSSAIHSKHQQAKQPKQVGSSPQQAQEQPGRQAVLALPSPVQQIGEGPRSQSQLPTTPARATSKSLSIPSTETPSQGVANTQPTSAQRAPTRRAFSWRNQHELLHSQRAAQAKREQSAAMAKPGNELAQPAEPSQAIVSLTPARTPSLVGKAPPDIASQNLLAQGGHAVRFMHRDGQWWASVRERIGEFYRIWVLPVACERHGDVAKALAELQEKPTKYTRSRIHVMHTQQSPYVPQFVYLGAQGLQGGGNGAGEPSGSGEPQDEPATGEQEVASGSEPSQSLIAPRGGSSLVTLQARMAQGGITSTASLVDSLNAAQPQEQQALQQPKQPSSSAIHSKLLKTEERGIIQLSMGFFSKLNNSLDICLRYLGDAASKYARDMASKRKIRTLELPLSHRAYINAKNKDGVTPLHEAAASGQKEMVACLLKKGVEIKATTQQGATPLHWAAMNGHKEMVAYLHAKGLDINATAHDGSTPLHWAACNGHQEVAAYLQSQGGDINAKTNNGNTLLHLVAINGDKEMVLYLCGQGLDINAGANHGLTALHEAACNGQKEVVGILLEQGASIEATAHDGSTPLHGAAYNGQKVMVDYLLEQGASINARTNKGQTALDLAKKKGHKELAAYLESQSSEPALRAYYQQPAFAQVKSLFEGEAPKHVDALQCQLMLIEQVKKPADRAGQQDDLSTHHERLERVKTPIVLEDLFKKRSIKPGEAEREIQRVLLVGEPGTGKTTLSRKLAYSWAQGDWGKEFEAVYVLPVRKLQQSQYDNGSFRKEETLATAIANNCFPVQNNKDKYKRLRSQISEELERSTTLLVLDGLDERYGASEALLRQAKAGRHKLLLLSRPYGIEQERTLVDIEIAHAGLSDGQMEAYVRGDLSSELGEELLQFIKEFPTIASIAHVPVNLQILCALWKDEGAGVRAETSNGSLPGLYRMLTEYIWERYARERKVQNENCEDVFDTLGKIALDALEQGEVLISPELVRDHVEVSRVRDMLQDMKDAGFLLLQAVGSQYQFPHLTFQEYFAGRALARQLLSGDAEDQAEVQDFFSEHQYEPQYGRMLSFFSGEVSKGQKKKGVNGIRQVLSLLEAAPQEVVGVQHLLLQMRLLNEWLCVAGKKGQEGLDKLEGEFHVMASLVEWFDEGLDRVWRADDRSWDDRKLLSLLTTGLQDSRAVADKAEQVLKLLLAACKDSYYDVRRAAREALVSVVKATPWHAPALVEPLLAACKDSYYDVRRAAREALVSVVKAAPWHAPALVEPLLAACRDSDYSVRSAAREALVSVVKAAPWHAPALVEPLLAACKDSAYSVRWAASDALWKVMGAAYRWVSTTPLSAFVQLPKATPWHAPALVEPLLAAYKDSASSARSAAIEALGEVAKATPWHAPALVEPLLAACKDPDYSVRWAAIEALWKVVGAAPDKARQVLEPLLAACKAGGDNVGEAACSALGEVAGAAPDLANQFLSPPAACIREFSNSRSQEAGISALGQLGKAAPELALEVLEPLLEACKAGGDNVREAACSALGEVAGAAPAQVLEPLIAACKNEDKYIRSAASEALGQLVQAAPELALEVLQPLIAACKDEDDDVREAAIEALERIAKAAPAQVLEPLIAACKNEDKYIRSAASEALGQLVQAAPELALEALQPLIAACKDSAYEVRSAASYALSSLVQAAPELALEVLQPLIAACKDEDYSVRSTASSALGQLVQAAPTEQVVEPLIAACKDSDYSVRSAASEALGQLGKAAPALASQVLEPLREACKDSAYEVRSAASSALSSLVQAVPNKAAQVLEPLIAACKDSAYEVRSAARYALGQLGKTAPELALEVIQPLMAACKDEDRYVRSAASSALAEVAKAAPELALEVLQPLIAACKDSDYSVRSAASEALGQLVQAAPAEQVLQPLLEACKHSDYSVRSAASEALGQVLKATPQNAEQVLPALIEAMRDSDADVRSTASEALGQVAKAAPELALEVLQPLIAACKDSDADVRSAASEALGQVGKAAPGQAGQVLQPLIAACKDSDADVRSAASEALGQFSLQQLIDTYWATQHQALIPLIAPQLYHTPLLIRTSLKPNHQRLVLYPTAGKPIPWDKPHQDVQNFVQKIKSAAKQWTPLMSAAQKGHLEVA